MIIKAELLPTAFAIAFVAQYITDRAKYLIPSDLSDKTYSVIVALFAFLAGFILTVVFNVELFTSDMVLANYLLTATFVGGGSAALNELIGALNNIKNKGEDK